MLVVLACGLCLAAHRIYWRPPPRWNDRFYLSGFLVLLVTASLGSFFARPGRRRWFQGFALFGWCHLIFVMQGGFGLTSGFDTERFIDATQLGVIFGFLAAVLAGLLLQPPVAVGTESNRERQRHED